MIAPTFALACAISAVGSLALARQAVRRKLPDGRDVGGMEITSGEKRKLRG